MANKIYPTNFLTLSWVFSRIHYPNQDLSAKFKALLLNFV